MTTKENFSNSDDSLRPSVHVGFERGGSSSENESAPIHTATLVSDAPFDASHSYGETRRQFESEFERRYVSWLLSRHCDNVSAAAREARMDRKHLHDLAKKHGLRSRSPRSSD